jgi:hypothetical protein
MESERGSIHVGPDTVEATKVAPTLPKIVKRRRLGTLLLCFSIVGLLFLSFIFGAAAMFFRLPLSDYMSKGFLGCRAWLDRQFMSEQVAEEKSPNAAIIIDQPGKTFDGYTLYACASMNAPSTRVYLIDMMGQIVHQWSGSFSKIWPNPPHIQDRLVHDSHVSIFACHLYPNGDLLVVFHSLERTVRGYGLAKIDKDSHVIWSYAANVHHDVVVGEDGTIYTIVQRQVKDSYKGLEYVPPPWLVDYLVMLSPEGKELREPISILDALRNSPYSTLLSPLETAYKPVLAAVPLWNADPGKDLRILQDLLHTNSVCVLTREMASKFPNFKEGQILISMRRLNALAVIDPSTSSVVWGTCGPWHFQHDAQFLDNGHLLIFDNIGSPHGSRVIEYDPQSGSFPWYYPGTDNPPFFTRDRGMAQRLPNGNTLIVDSEEKEMFEVTKSKEVVWTYVAHGFISTARRYRANQLLFLKDGQRPRP